MQLLVLLVVVPFGAAAAAAADGATVAEDGGSGGGDGCVMRDDDGDCANTVAAAVGVDIIGRISRRSISTDCSGTILHPLEDHERGDWLSSSRLATDIHRFSIHRPLYVVERPLCCFHSDATLGLDLILKGGCFSDGTIPNGSQTKGGHIRGIQLRERTNCCSLLAASHSLLGRSG
uniref:Putative secreted peptide n=1 Tax=Anopheles braziliensis TaxID=58242 RepID=A0A2M3ZPG0_9DIPT